MKIDLIGHPFRLLKGSRLGRFSLNVNQKEASYTCP